MNAMMNEGTILGEAKVEKETDKAILVSIEDHDESVWIPKSVIHDDSEVYSEEHGEGMLVVAKWWADKNGF